MLLFHIAVTKIKRRRSQGRVHAKLGASSLFGQSLEFSQQGCTDSLFTKSIGNVQGAKLIVRFNDDTEPCDNAIDLSH